MNVGELIKQLKKFPKSMEVKVHNGLVDDWQHFRLVETQLEKWDDDYIYNIAKKQDEGMGRDSNYHKSHVKKQEWIYRNYSDVKENMHYKKALLIDPKPRNKEDWGRGGSIHY